MSRNSGLVVLKLAGQGYCRSYGVVYSLEHHLKRKQRNDGLSQFYVPIFACSDVDRVIFFSYGRCEHGLKPPASTGAFGEEPVFQSFGRAMAPEIEAPKIGSKKNIWAPKMVSDPHLCGTSVVVFFGLKI